MNEADQIEIEKHKCPRSARHVGRAGMQSIEGIAARHSSGRL